MAEYTKYCRPGNSHFPSWGYPCYTQHVNIEIYADPLLKKVFFNLIDNSLRHNGAKMSYIRVTASQNPSKIDELVISVEDDGLGVGKEDKPHLFTKGFGKNTGLGLYLSKEILSITGLTIQETGEPGKGARFEILVPKGKYRKTPHSH